MHHFSLLRETSGWKCRWEHYRNSHLGALFVCLWKSIFVCKHILHPRSPPHPLVICGKFAETAALIRWRWLREIWEITCVSRSWSDVRQREVRTRLDLQWAMINLFVFVWMCVREKEKWERKNKTGETGLVGIFSLTTVLNTVWYMLWRLKSVV